MSARLTTLSIRFLSLPSLLLLTVTGAAPVAAQASFSPDEVIAAFLLRFPQFVEWPESALEGRQDLQICVAEPDPFGSHLEALAEGEQLLGRRFTTRRVSGPGMLDGCHVLYVSSVANRASALLEAASERPLLTVGESSDFLAQGGIIHLIIGPNVRFQVNAEAAERAGLQLSSQLLALAVSIWGNE